MEPIAAAIGEAWANELVHALRLADREVEGAWPGTMREARMRVLASLRVRMPPNHLEELARAANLAARRGWNAVSELSPSP
jgi:hypothetical protein